MMLPPSWSVATRSGDVPVTVAYRRCTRRDMLDVARWWQASGYGLEIGADPAELDKEETQAVCEAMATRLILWPAGDYWTDRDLLTLSKVDPGLYAWFYGLLYWPAIAGVSGLESLASALQTPVASNPHSVPGNPAATDCGECLVTVHEPWDPAKVRFGRSTGVPYPFPRTIGDSICQGCVKFDPATGKPRETLGAHDLACAELLRSMKVTGHLPEDGGILDQDADLWARMDLIADSVWFKSMTGAPAK